MLTQCEQPDVARSNIIVSDWLNTVSISGIQSLVWASGERRGLPLRASADILSLSALQDDGVFGVRGNYDTENVEKDWARIGRGGERVRRIYGRTMESLKGKCIKRAKRRWFNCDFLEILTVCCITFELHPCEDLDALRVWEVVRWQLIFRIMPQLWMWQRCKKTEKEKKNRRSIEARRRLQHTPFLGLNVSRNDVDKSTMEKSHKECEGGPNHTTVLSGGTAVMSAKA